MDIVVRAGSDAGRALAAGPERTPPATAPAASTVAQALRRLRLARFALLNPRTYKGS
ncbi:hypothetical protein GCM10010358_57260 [Streptomyces minutiscleroticus]|uniref:Uncharacterized protein n=1 Tax=Streptomyces minutiscleroticus TaxID=68238 RepID=A0A918NUL4_9ACTN|nr:hypothetical protein GCM10010358_57260 [Streptomyces minutiscleroticus]